MRPRVVPENKSCDFPERVSAGTLINLCPIRTDRLRSRRRRSRRFPYQKNKHPSAPLCLLYILYSKNKYTYNNTRSDVFSFIRLTTVLTGSNRLFGSTTYDYYYCTSTYPPDTKTQTNNFYFVRSALAYVRYIQSGFFYRFRVHNMFTCAYVRACIFGAICCRDFDSRREKTHGFKNVCDSFPP